MLQPAMSVWWTSAALARCAATYTLLRCSLTPGAAAAAMLADCCCCLQDVGRLENIVGWYHSHPGYGCWLSGIDCSTQMLNQQYQVGWVSYSVVAAAAPTSESSRYIVYGSCHNRCADEHHHGRAPAAMFAFAFTPWHNTMPYKLHQTSG
jgi:hypothetical protein